MLENRPPLVETRLWEKKRRGPLPCLLILTPREGFEVLALCLPPPPPPRRGCRDVTGAEPWAPQRVSGQGLCWPRCSGADPSAQGSSWVFGGGSREDSKGGSGLCLAPLGGSEGLPQHRVLAR